MKYKNKSLRHELKYIINYHEYQYLKNRLMGIMEQDVHSGEDGYDVRSLYFDDIYQTALNEKEEGILFRQKYRVRIYNGSSDQIKLERKEKYNELISKETMDITLDQFYKLTERQDIDFLLNANKDMPAQMYWAIKTRGLAPAVIVDYQREVMVADEGNVRITFDKDLAAGINTSDIFADDIAFVRVFEPGIMILEVKYDDFLPDYIKKALQITSHIKMAYSKYVYCRLTQLKHNPIAKYYLR